jgi:hypothetical protein
MPQETRSGATRSPAGPRRRPTPPDLLRPGALAAVILAAGLGLGCGVDGIGIAPTTCSTKTSPLASEGPLMEPGGDCIGCHSSGEGPRFTLAGTVMSANNDDTNCTGVNQVTVRVTGADGHVIEMATNQVGNFYSEVRASTLVFPYTAEVTRNGVTTKMLTPRSAGETSCNSCHTPTGANGAPGRIIAP